MTLETLAQDLKYALRGLRAKPGFTTAVVLTLALGIGANAAMFGIVDRMLFRPPPMLRDPATAHPGYGYQTARGKEKINNGGQFARFRDYAAETRSFSSVAGHTRRDLAVGIGDAAREMSVAAVSATFFAFFDAPPVIGRYFIAAEDSIPEGEPVAVLSHNFWSMQYGERRDAIGSPVQIGQTIYTVIGVAPAGFVGLWPDQPPVAFIPITNFGAVQARRMSFLKSGEKWWTTYHWGWMSTLVRRKPNVSIEAASADLTNVTRQTYLKQLAENAGK